jgi:hypothetical protein
MNIPASDDELLGMLGDLLRRVDPMPEMVRDAASASLGWRDPDSALAILIADSAAEQADKQLTTVRGAAPRLLTFEVGERSVDLEVTSEARQARLVGQIMPNATATVTIQHGDGTSEVEADALGRFVVNEVASGLVRVCWSNNGSRVCTEWFFA